jgi:hypothetical protein
MEVEDDTIHGENPDFDKEKLDSITGNTSLESERESRLHRE